MTALAEILIPSPPAPLFVLREGVGADHAHVYASWLHAIEGTVFDAAFRGAVRYVPRAVINGLLGRRTTALVVACAPTDPNTILGWALVEAPSTLHFVHVKPFLRRRGVAKALIAGLREPLTYTANTPAFTPWASRHGWWRFDPLAAFVR